MHYTITIETRWELSDRTRLALVRAVRQCQFAGVTYAEISEAEASDDE